MREPTIHFFYILVVNKAWKTLECEESRAKCMEVIEEAKARTDHMVATPLFNSFRLDYLYFLRYLQQTYYRLQKRKRKLKRREKSQMELRFQL